MDKEELVEKVSEICRSAGLDYLFVIDGCVSSSVTPDSCDTLRRLKVLFDKISDDTEYELLH